MDALERAAADGKHGRNYQITEQTNALSHIVPGASHYVQLELTAQESIAGATSAALEALAHEQDSDAALAFLYIARLLAPPAPLPLREFPSGKVDFDDVLAKIGWVPRSTAERREMHKRILQFILFGERAQVVGSRRGKYRDKHTGEIIDTVIRSALWRIHTTETPEQKNLFAEPETPLAVELVMSREWAQLLAQPSTAQYLPMGELLGAIPGNKSSGAWARVVGLALASFWRRQPRAALDGSIQPKRRELLERYPPKTGAVSELLASDKPHRAMSYWCGALKILSEKGFIECLGEAEITLAQMKRNYPRKGWADVWIDETVYLVPGPLIRPAIEVRGNALPPGLGKSKK